MSETQPTPESADPSDQPEQPQNDLAQAVELQKQSAEDHHTPGTVALTFIFLLCFAIYYFANWKALADVWHVR